MGREDGYGYQVIFEDTYFGQTMQKFDLRVNVHRSCFRFEDCFKTVIMHAYEHHGFKFSIDNYRFSIEDELKMT